MRIPLRQTLAMAAYIAKQRLKRNKFYPLVLFPALYRRGDFKMPATVASVIAVAYAAYSSVGMLVFGFLGGYALGLMGYPWLLLLAGVVLLEKAAPFGEDLPRVLALVLALAAVAAWT